jgi:hypothetical protein
VKQTQSSIEVSLEMFCTAYYSSEIMLRCFDKTANYIQLSIILFLNVLRMHETRELFITPKGLVHRVEINANNVLPIIFL